MLEQALPPDAVAPARVIVCEQRGRWAPVVRQAVAGRGTPVYETCSLADAGEELQRSPASLLVLELTPTNEEPLLRRLIELATRFPLAGAIVVAERGLEPAAVVLREAGVLHVAFSPQQLLQARGLIRRHLDLAPAPAGPLRESVWQRLPWSGGARTREPG